MSKPEPQEKRIDPLIEEVRAVRKEISERFGNDVNKLCDYLVQLESQYKERIVHPAKRPPAGEAAHKP